jgi:hypothetical protein
MAPALSRTVNPIAMALGVGELPIIVWLLICGAKVKPSGATPLASQ